jgi:GntR family transcriptional regulator
VTLLLTAESVGILDRKHLGEFGAEYGALMSLLFGDIDFNSHTLIFEQMVNQLKYQVASGRLAPGVETPPICVPAKQLLVIPNTVARVYRRLELAGVVTKRRTAGTYVSGAGSPLDRRERVRILIERADAHLAEALQMNVRMEEIVELLRQGEDAMNEQPRER